MSTLPDSSSVSAPLPASAESIPGALTLLHNEFQATCAALEETRHQLDLTRQQLALQMYRNDGAVRVILRLQRERDQARAALAAVRQNLQDATPAPPSGPSSDPSSGPSSGPSDPVAESIEQFCLSHSGRSRRDALKTARSQVPAVPSSPNWSVSSTSRVLFPKNRGGITCLAWADPQTDPDNLVGGGEDGRVHKVQQGRAVAGPFKALESHGAVLALACLQGDGPVLWAAAQDGTVAVWTSQDELVGELSPWSAKGEHDAHAVGAAVHPTGLYWVCAMNDGRLVLGTIQDASLKLWREIQVASHRQLTCVTIHPDGQLVMVGTAQGAVLAFDVVTQQGQVEPVASLVPEDVAAVTGLMVSPNGYTMVAAYADGVVRVWDLRHQQCAVELPALSEECGPVRGLEMDSTARFLMLTCEHAVLLLETKDWKQVWQTEPEFKEIQPQVALLSVGAQQIVVAGVDRKLHTFVLQDAMERE